MSPSRILIVAASGALAATLAGAALGAGGPLAGSVGPGFGISLKDGSGATVTSLEPGSYELTVDDKADSHNFHLTGPGVDVATEVDTIQQATFSLALVEGRYSFVCDAHPLTMKGAFTVGNPPADPGTGGGAGSGGTTTPPRPSAAVGSKLVLTSGPGFAISLKTPAGKRVTRLRPGPYTVLVRDRSRVHDARLRGAGVSRATTVPFVGTQTWKIVLRKGKLVFQCDPHATTMRGSVIVAP